MPLPRIAAPTYELELPSSGKTIQYRPFLVKEEKVLVIALESEDTKQITTAIKNVIKNCVLTKGLKIESLPTFDIEYLFLNIRGKSVGETADVLITCPDDGKTQVPHSVNLDDIQVEVSDDHSRDIKLDDDLTVRMKYPSMNEFIKNNFSASTDITVDDTFNVITACIEQVYNEEESWAASDCTKKELKEFIEQLSSKQFKMIENFFNTMPRLKHVIKVTNPNTGVENEIVLEGLTSFFA